MIGAAVALLLASAPTPARAADGPLTLARGPVTVVYWPGREGQAARTLRAALEPLPLPGLPEGADRTPITVVLARDPAAFDSVTGGLAPEWSSGVAIPARRLIVLPGYPSSRTAQADPIVALRHERVHLALHAFLPGPIPRWFDEGYATWAAGELDESSGWEIRFALLRGAAPPLDSLTLDWPAASPDARLAYLLSASAVRFLAARSGPGAFEAFMATWQRAGRFETALRTVYGITPTGFERAWREMVKTRYGWLLAISQVGAFWVLFTLLFLALGLARRRRDRRVLARMEAEEAEESAWTGEPEALEDVPEPGAADDAEPRLPPQPGPGPRVDDDPRRD